MSEGKSDEGQEKSHDATPERLDKARRDGDVAQSRDLNAAASYLGFYLALAIVGAGAAGKVSFSLAQIFHHPGDVGEMAFDASRGGDFIISLATQSAMGVVPFFLLPALATLGALFAQRAIAFAPSKIKPKMSRLSVISNAKKKYGTDGLVEFAKNSVKLLFVFILFGFFFAQRFASLPIDARLPATALPASLLKEGVVFVGIIVLFSVAIASIDLPWSRHTHAKRLKMTYEDLKKESKESEGDPEMKRSRRERAQSVARNTMLRDVPDADVVIVNPTHYAVALKWQRDKGRAPICVAKGVNELAGRIREIAAIAGIPIKSDPPTARAIHASVEVGEEIKREHYAAVAAAIHFADVIKAKAKAL